MENAGLLIAIPGRLQALLPPWLSPSMALIIAIATGLVYFAYRFALPKPLPGIPYNEAAAHSILGDLPEMIRVANRGKGFRPWLGELAYRHNSPIVQWFPVPLGSPLVLIIDHRESLDIISHRTKEIDRGVMTVKYFGPIMPDHHIAMQSTDPRFKANKELVKDLMTPAFLSDVSAPSIYATTQTLVDLWAIKADLAKGRPFSAFEDIHAGAMDIILAVSFGLDDENSIIQAQKDMLSALTDLESPGKPDEPFTFPRREPSAEVQALMTVTQSLEVTLKSPVPEIHHWILRQTLWRKAFRIKEQFLTDQINTAVLRLLKSKANEETMRCAMDHMILREVAAANKAGRSPEFQTPRMRDELFGYLLAGHETTSTTIAWILKFLADNQSSQATLRRQLHQAYAAALAERRQPTVTEITKIAAPYLDAFLEESLRHSNTFSILTRQATADTTILRHHIPKGTNILMYIGGPSVTRPGVPVSESRRSETSRATKDRVGGWDSESMTLFEPRRWLKRREDSIGEGEFDGVAFNPQAGPSLPFGAGPRGCFGKRLAYLELRIVVVLLVWNFEFGQCAPELSSYDGVDVLTTFPKQCFIKLARSPLRSEDTKV